MICIAGCQHSNAEPGQRFEAFGCEIEDLGRELPNACRTVFSLNDLEAGTESHPNEDRAQEVYAAELSFSLGGLSPYSISLSDWNGKWQLVGFVGRSDPEKTASSVYARDYRSVHFDVPAGRVEQFKKTLLDQSLDAAPPPEAIVANEPNGDNAIGKVCVDGARLYAKYLSAKSVWAVERHDCRGRTDIDALADALFDLAVEFDPKLDAYRFTLPSGQMPD